VGERTPQFGRVPTTLLGSDTIKAMRGADAKVYLAICARADPRGQCHPSIETLAEDTRLSPRCVYECIDRLEASGAVVINHGGGRHKVNTYTLMLNGERAFSVSSEKPCTPARETLNAGAQNPERQRRKTLNQRSPQQSLEQTSNRQENRTAAVEHLKADADPSTDGQTQATDSTRSALKAAGVGEPARTELAATPGVTAELVERIAARTRETGGGAGLIVQRLREAAPEAAREAAAQARIDAAREWWATLTDAERRTWAERVRATWPNLASREDDDPHMAGWAARVRENGRAAAEVAA